MQKPRDIEIVESDPFKNDLLARESEIKNLTPIVLNYNDPLVLALDAPWGAGKTTFVKIWQAYLKQQGNWCIGFNAWETDFADDPLIVLVAELNSWFKEKLDQSEFEKWTEGVKSALPNIAKRVAVAAVKGATFGALDISTDLERTAAELTGNIASDLLENFNKQSKSIKQFKELIAEILDNLPVEQKNLIIFIDELDRCRPTYAIELLERIKHLFSIERLVFVLSTDTIQLAHSIRAIYGNDFDGKKYLQRFIDLDYALEKPDPEKYIDALFKSLGIERSLNERSNDNITLIKDCFLILIKRFKLTLRDINLLLVRFRLILYSIPQNHYIDAPLLVSLLILRDQDKDLYYQYIENPNVAEKVIACLLGEKPYETESNGKVALNYIIAHLIAPVRERNPDEFDRLIQPYSNEEYKTEREKDHTVIELAKCQSRNSLCLKATVERIELVHQINIEV
jgi:hypothetical protein